MKWLVNVTLTLASIAYPILWWLDNGREYLHLLPWLLSSLWLVKAVLQAVKFQRIFAILMAVLLAVVAATRQLDTMYWYPVIINGVMLALFGSSLWAKQTVVERLARLQTPDLPESGIRYTRRVTQVWCSFFLFNIFLTSAFILCQQYDLWAIYSGGIAYLLMGLLFLGEWWIRPKQ